MGETVHRCANTPLFFRDQWVGIWAAFVKMLFVWCHCPNRSFPAISASFSLLYNVFLCRASKRLPLIENGGKGGSGERCEL